MIWTLDLSVSSLTCCHLSYRPSVPFMLFIILFIWVFNFINLIFNFIKFFQVCNFSYLKIPSFRKEIHREKNSLNIFPDCGQCFLIFSRFSPSADVKTFWSYFRVSIIEVTSRLRLSRLVNPGVTTC